MVTVAVISALLFCGGFCWQCSRFFAKQNADFQQRLGETYERALGNLAQSTTDVSAAVGVAVSSAVQAALAPPPGVTRDVNAREVARELYEQGAVPSFTDPTDDSDPTDLFYPVQGRPNVIGFNGDDLMPTGVPGVVFPVSFPPPKM